MKDITQYYDFLTNYAKSVEFNPDNVKDLVQETYLRALESNKFQNESHPKTWLIGIMKNIRKNYIREGVSF